MTFRSYFSITVSVEVITFMALTNAAKAQMKAAIARIKKKKLTTSQQAFISRVEHDVNNLSEKDAASILALERYLDGKPVGENKK